MTLPPATIDALLGAIADPRQKPNDQEVNEALAQLAHAAAAICRAVRKGSRDKFEMLFAMEMERLFAAKPDEEDE